MIRIRRLVLFTVLCGAAFAGHTQPSEPDPRRFADEIEAFQSWDRKNSFPADGILFVGSSSIRFWPTAAAFPGLPVINRGFGGAHIADVIHYYDQVVKPYRPATIVFYAGDNDIARDKAPARVLADFQEFAGRVRAELPEARILFLSIKPSLARWAYWPAMVEANAMIRDYIAGEPRMTYVDLATPLLDENGEPADVYVEDGLHLNDRGYRLWKEAFEPFLD